MNAADCEKTRAQLPDYQAGALPESRQAAVARHLAACEACRAELAALERTADLLSATAPQRPSRDLWPGIAAQLAPRTPSRAWWRVLTPARPHWALAAAALIVIALVLLLPLTVNHTPAPSLTVEMDDEAPLFAQWHAEASLGSGLGDPYALALVALNSPGPTETTRAE